MKAKPPILDSKTSEKLHYEIKKPIIVIGDLILDSYTDGSVNKVSVEAPVPILLNPSPETFYIGGSGNVAHNLQSLGNHVVIISGIGCNQNGEIDQSAKTLSKLLEENNISTSSLVKLKRQTTKKKRILGNNQQLLRIDEEITDSISAEEDAEVIKKIKEQIKNASAIVVSDYAKGFITEKVATHIQETAKENKIPLIVDLKPKTITKFKSFDLIKCNLRESQEISGIAYDNNFNNIESIAKKISALYSSDVVITCGSKGIVSLEKNGNCYHIQAKTREIFDVTGVSDTVTAALAHGFVRSIPIDENCIFATTAASIAISKKGVYSVNIKEVDSEISKVIMPKTWGHEEWIVNSEYCGKKLVLNEGHCCSLHYHKIKDETFYIASGKVGFQLNNEHFILNPGDSLLITPGTKHRFYGLQNSEIFEFSTHHLEEDSYRDEVSGTFEKSLFDKVPNYSSREKSNR